MILSTGFDFDCNFIPIFSNDDDGLPFIVSQVSHQETTAGLFTGGWSTRNLYITNTQTISGLCQRKTMEIYLKNDVTPYDNDDDDDNKWKWPNTAINAAHNVEWQIQTPSVKTGWW